MDLNTLKEKADENIEKKTREALEDIRKRTSDRQTRGQAVIASLDEAYAKKAEQKRAAMEREKEAAAAAAADKVREKYANQSPSLWNESARTKQLRELRNSLFNKGGSNEH